MSVHVVAQYRARPETADQVEEILRRHVEATRAEPGCLGFTVLRSLEDPVAFLLQEEYVDETALAAHRDSEHFRHYIRTEAIPLLVSRTAALHRAVGSTDPVGDAPLPPTGRRGQGPA